MALVAAENRLLGHYRLLAPIGSGGMGVVYRAHDEHLDRDVAVKVLLPAAITGQELDPKARRGLRQEALTLSRLNHTNIAHVYDFDQEGDTDFAVMELVPGESLAHKLHAEPLAQDVLLPIATQMLDGLVAAHAQGIIHRDLKPANLQITPDGLVKILDFGLARFLRRKGLGAASATTASDTEGVSGTLPYMSPERCTANHVTRAAISGQSESCCMKWPPAVFPSKARRQRRWRMSSCTLPCLRSTMARHRCRCTASSSAAWRKM